MWVPHTLKFFSHNLKVSQNLQVLNCWLTNTVCRYSCIQSVFVPNFTYLASREQKASKILAWFSSRHFKPWNKLR